MIKSKISIIGCGKVGSTIAYTLAINNIANEIVLIDADRNKARGEALDICHALNFGNTYVYDGYISDIKSSNIIIIAAGVGRKPGETRFDLTVRNAAIIKDIAEQIILNYNSGVILVVTNPVDVITYLLTKYLDLPVGRVIGTGTTLDTARFKYEISKYFNVDKNSVYACVLGEHGEQSVPMWSLTSIDGIGIEEYSKSVGILFGVEQKELLNNQVKNAGTEIINLRGATFYGISTGVTTLAKAIIGDTNAILPVSSVLNGQYKINYGAVSLLSMIGSNGIIKHLTPVIPQIEQELLVKSALHIQTEINKITI